MRAVEADADDGEDTEGHPIDIGVRDGGERGADLGEAGLWTWSSSDCRMFDVPGEEDVDSADAAAGGGADGLTAGDVLHGFFNGAGDGGHHFVGGHVAVLTMMMTRGKLVCGKTAGGHVQSGIGAAQGDGEHQEGDGDAVANRKSPHRRVHVWRAPESSRGLFVFHGDAGAGDESVSAGGDDFRTGLEAR